MPRTTRGCEICFLLGKTPAETLVMLETAYGDTALNKTRVYGLVPTF